MFIKLHDGAFGKPILVNADHIRMVTPEYNNDCENSRAVLRITGGPNDPKAGTISNERRFVVHESFRELMDLVDVIELK